MKRPVWFAAKTTGVGAGWPLRWQGWAAVIVFLCATAMAAWRLDGATRMIVVAGLVVAFATIALVTTERRDLG